MKKTLPFAAALLLIAAAILTIFVLSGCEAKSFSSFDGAAFVCAPASVGTAVCPGDTAL